MYPASNPNPFMRGTTEMDGLGARMMNGLTNLIGGGEPEDTVDAATVQDRYNNLRDSVRGRVGELGYDGAYRPLEVLSPEDFEGDVAALRAKVDKIDLAAVRNLSDAWKKITERNSTSLTDFQSQIARGTDPQVWRGATADAAAQTVADYQAMGARVSSASALTGNKIDELLTGLEPTKELVPHAPEHRSGIDNARSWVVGRGWRNDDVAEANAATEARRVLRTVYAPVVRESDADVPVIPLPKPIGSDGGVPDGGGGNGGGGGSTGGAGTRPASETPDGTQPATVIPDEGQNAPQNSQQPDDTTQDQDSQDPGGDTTPQSSPETAAAGTPNTPTTPNVGSPGGGPGSGLGAGGGAGAGGSGGGSPGAAVPGTPGSGLAAARAGAGTAAGSSAGRAGMGGMGAPGAGRGKGEDEEAKGVPDYLINQANGNELTGLDDLPKTVPPVIGS
ncbi:hypothetical protein [Nocardia lasii]|uniref:PPE domain-containing protein n=1 Tax=Nocardia lasii TaxID=1616107 RepID=A0ABW1JPT6_9NOCA